MQEENIFTRDFILVLFAFFAFMAAFYALIPTLPIYFSQLGSGERLVGMLIGVTGVASLVSRLLVGGFLRRYSEKRAMIFGAVLFSLTFPATILFRSFWPLLAVRIVQGIAFASMHTAAITYAINVIPPAFRGQGLAYFMLVPNLAMALVAPSGMICYQPIWLHCFLFELCRPVCVRSAPDVEGKGAQGCFRA